MFYSFRTAWKIIKINTAEQKLSALFSHTIIFLFFFFKPGTLISHNANQPPSDITVGHLSDDMQQKASHYLFRTCSNTQRRENT